MMDYAPRERLKQKVVIFLMPRLLNKNSKPLLLTIIYNWKINYQFLRSFYACTSLLYYHVSCYTKNPQHESFKMIMDELDFETVENFLNQCSKNFNFWILNLQKYKKKCFKSFDFFFHFDNSPNIDKLHFECADYRQCWCSFTMG